MTVALVHDFLTQRGGAERVVLALAKTLRDPVIVTACYAPDETFPEFADFNIVAAKEMSGREAKRFRAGVLSYPKTFRSFDLDQSDLAVISSSAFAHHVQHRRSAVYWHTPPRFLHDPAAYVPKSLEFPLAGVVKALTTPLRRTDRKAALGHSLYAANSGRTAVRLRSAYGIDAPVIYPPLDTDKFGVQLTAHTGASRALVVSRLLPYKRIDLAIAACKLAGIPLTVIGEGPERAKLHRLAGDDVTFLEGVSDAELIAAYAEHSLVICPGIDDFGYIPLEAGYSGRPVVATATAGAQESVRHGSSGLLVEGDDPATWAAAIRTTVERAWSPNQLRSGVLKFGADAFTARLGDWLAPLADPADVLRAPVAPVAASSAPAVAAAA